MPWNKKKVSRPADTPTKTDKPNRHSYSSWALYHKCPYAYKCRYILKIETPEHPASKRGSALHKEGEDYMNGEIAELESKEWEAFKPKLDQRKDLSPQPEIKIAFDKEWNHCEWNAKTAWVRMVLDLLVPGDSIETVDYKTGKIYETHRDQSDLYSLGSMLKYPEVEEHTVSFWYLDQKVIHNYRYSTKESDKLKSVWTRRFTQVEKDNLYAPKPGVACRWCNFSKKKGGPCLAG